MTTTTLKPTTIAAYINAASPDLQPRLVALHAAIRTAAPDAVEGLKWGMPAFSMQKILVTFAAFKNHIGFYPMPSAIKAFKKELSKFKTAEGSVQFPHNQPLPLALVKKIVKFRVKENKEGVIKWRQ